VVYRKVNGTPKRITLGRFPDLSPDSARREAIKVLAQLAVGGDPNEEKKAARARGVTLNQVFEDYLRARKSLKPGTIHDYKRIMRETFSDWVDRPLKRITKEDVKIRHLNRGKQSEARANNAMRLLRALFNFASGEYEDHRGMSLFPENPVNKLSHSKAWYRVERRQTVVKSHELPAWFKAVSELSLESGSPAAETVRDYFFMIIFTGLRREEAARLEWTAVDMKSQTLSVPDTKNREPHVLPIPDFLFQLLARRYLKRGHDKYVFPGSGKTGHIADTRRQLVRAREMSGINFTLHDLRRTFITVAESLDISAYALKQLMNHKMTGDVTAGYIVRDVERLRKPMQNICNHMLSLGKVECMQLDRPKKKVVKLNSI
jgi:integrase